MIFGNKAPYYLRHNDQGAESQQAWDNDDCQWTWSFFICPFMQTQSRILPSYNSKCESIKSTLDLIVSTERKIDSYVQRIGSEPEELLHWACTAMSL